MSDQTETQAEQRSRWAELGWQALVWVIVALVLLVLLAQNVGAVRVGIFFITWRVSLAVWSLLCVAAGVAVTMAIFWARRRR